MVARQSSVPLYVSVIADIESRIASGIYRPGDKIPSLNQICDNYSVSKITAVRVVHELQASGAVKKIAGKGTFVNGMKALQKQTAVVSKMRRIAVITENESSGIYDKDTYYGRVAFSASEYATEKSLETRFECLNVNKTNQKGDLLSTTFQAKPDEGLIVITSSSDLNVVSMLVGAGASSVAVDLFLHGKKCVLHDNNHGVSSIMDHFCSKGVRKVLLAGRFGTQNSINENERHEAFLREVKLRNLDGEAVLDGNFNDLLKRFKNPSTRPDAVIFTQDSPAMHLMKMLEEKGYRVPEDVLVSGFDDYPTESSSRGLTTYRVDCRAMGRAAVDYLIENNDLPWQAPLIKRIQGKLIIRNSA